MLVSSFFISDYCFTCMVRYFGNIDVSVTSAAFFVAMALLLQRGNPRFAQLSSAMFGLFYCGYLPCFWVKLRCGLAAPALNTSKKCFFFSLIFYKFEYSKQPTSEQILSRHELSLVNASHEDGCTGCTEWSISGKRIFFIFASLASLLGRAIIMTFG